MLRRWRSVVFAVRVLVRKLVSVPIAGPWKVFSCCSGVAASGPSVLFGDLVGFAALSESRDAEEVRGAVVGGFRGGPDRGGWVWRGD